MWMQAKTVLTVECHCVIVFQLNHAIAGKTEPFEHVNIDWGFVPVNTSVLPVWHSCLFDVRCLFVCVCAHWCYNSSVCPSVCHTPVCVKTHSLLIIVLFFSELKCHYEIIGSRWV